MKILLLTHGTRGDTQPFVALGRALIAAGHEVILAAPASTRRLVTDYDLRFVPVHDTWNDLKNDPVVRTAFETGYRGLRGKRFAIEVMRRFRPLMARALDDMAAAASEHGADLVVCHSNGPMHQLGEVLGVPAVPVCLEPIWVPTRSFTNPVLPFQLPRILNRTSYLATKRRIQTFTGDGSAWRRDTLGLPNRRHRHPLRRPDGGPSIVLQAFSRHVLPHPVEYPDWVHTTGFWSLPASANWKPPPQLSAFLAAGEPPVYIGFGSLPHIAPDRIRPLLVDATRYAGVRAVVVPRWLGDNDDAGERLLCLDEAPFDWLFPRVSAIVHHGGCGTVGAVLASGHPQVVCPAEPAQAFFARRMHADGVAPPPLPQRNLTAQNLASAIQQALTNKTLASKAAELGYQIRAENGVGTAVKVLESLP